VPLAHADGEGIGAEGSEGAFGSEVPTSPQPPSDPSTEAANLVLPETVSYEGTDYTLTSIAPYAFYLSGVTDVTLPASVSDVDDRAFRLFRRRLVRRRTLKPLAHSRGQAGRCHPP